MPTGPDIVDAAARYLGVVESPRGSNCQRFSARLGHRCQPWCADFVTCVYLDCEIDLRSILTPASSSCAAILAAAQAKRWTIAQSAAGPGDLVLFQFDRDPQPDHVEIVASTTGGRLVTIGGNTGGPNPANGGMVAKQGRSWATVMAVVRIPDIEHHPRAVLTSAISHPNPEARPLPAPIKDDDDMPGYLFSDGQQVWLTDGKTRRRVSFNGDRFRELIFLGQARNAVDSAGNIEIPTHPAYLAEIPVVG